MFGGFNTITSSRGDFNHKINNRSSSFHKIDDHTNIPGYDPPKSIANLKKD